MGEANDTDQRGGDSYPLESRLGSVHLFASGPGNSGV